MLHPEDHGLASVPSSFPDSPVASTPSIAEDSDMRSD
jgi:hypothetical protein